jgi:hypothetical protein
VIYECLGNGRTAEGTPIFPTQFIPNRDSIMVAPGDWRDIAYITRPMSNNSKNVPLGTIVFEPSGKGIMPLNGNNSQHVLLDEYLQICNYNASNPMRDTSKVAYFKRQDVVGDAKKVFDDNLAKARLSIWAAETPLDELEVLLTQRGHVVTGLAEAIVRQTALNEATKNPFTAEAAQKGGFEVHPAFAQKLKEAIEAEVIKFSPVDKCMKNLEFGTLYPVKGLLQTTAAAKKAEMLLDACLSDAKLYAAVNADIEQYYNI